MNTLQAIGSLFASFWQLFSLPHPVLGISFGSLFIGVFVVGLSLRILEPLLGIGDKSRSGLLRRRKDVKNERSDH